VTQNPEDAQPFDHDAYVRSRLPDFVLVGMGLKAPSSPVPKYTPPRRSSPATSGNPHTRVRQPAAKPAQKQVTTPVSPQPEPPARSREDPATRLAKQTVTAVLAVPVWLIVILLVFGVLHGAPEPSETVVNDKVTCDHAETVPVANIGTDRYWERC
jgi:hypothetical protein